MSLNKQLCKNCLLNKNKQKWNKFNEKQWNEGWVKCPLTFDASDEKIFKIDQLSCLYKGSGIDVLSNPPYNCPFHLEHILKEQEDVK